MPWICRLLMVLIAAAFLLNELRKVWKDKIQAEDSLFWVVVCALAVVLGIFPGIVTGLASLMGLEPMTMLLALAVLALAFRCLVLTNRLSALQNKLYVLIQDINVRRAASDDDADAGTAHRDDVA